MNVPVFNLMWAVVLLPLLGASVSFLSERPRRAAQTCLAFTVLTAVTAIFVLGWRLSHWAMPYENTLTFWLMHPAEANLFPGDFSPQFGIRVDTFSVSFTAVFAFLAMLLQGVSISTLRNDQALRRTSWVSSAFITATLGAVASPNLFQFWMCFAGAGVGALIMGLHNWENLRLSAGVLRAFVAGRAGELLLLLGLAFTFVKFAVNASSAPLPAGAPVSAHADPLNFSVLARTWNLASAGDVTGVGSRTLVLLAIIFVAAAIVRSFQIPFGLLLLDVADLPLTVVGLIATGILLTGSTLLVRSYALLSLTPQVLAALAIYAVVSAVVFSIKALGQRNLVRSGICVLLAQAALALATIACGGYSPGIFMLFTLLPAATLFFLAANNVARAYRSRLLQDFGGGWRYTRPATLSLLVWALYSSGAGLTIYSLISSVMRNQTPKPVAPSIAAVPFGTPAPVFGQPKAIVVAVLVMALIAFACLTVAVWRCFAQVAGGRPMPRRGFDPNRLRELKLGGTRVMALTALSVVAAVLAGLPGVTAFGSGKIHVPALTFSHFIFFGDVHQRLDLEPVALGTDAAWLVAGIVLAWFMFRRSETVRSLTAAGSRVLVWYDDFVHGIASRLGQTVEWTAALLRATDAELVTGVYRAAGEGAGMAVARSRRLLSGGSAAVMTAALTVVVLGICLLLGVSHHFPLDLR